MSARDLIENDGEHGRQLGRTGYWGRQGAGAIILARDTGRILLPQRSGAVLEPGTWGTWGGAIDSGEKPESAVRREVGEEAGATAIEKVVPLYVFRDGQKFTYHNFLVVVPQEFKPTLNWETARAQWCEFGHWPAPLHPGLQALLRDKRSLKTIQVERGEARATVQESVAELAAQFIGRDDAFWEIRERGEQGGGGSVFPSGYSGVQCTGYACAILQRLGPARVQVYGFGPENKSSVVAQDCGGHDFAVVDGRYIVDPWLTDIEVLDTQGVFDLQSPRDAKKIRSYYGDPKLWRRARAEGKSVTFRPEN